VVLPLPVPPAIPITSIRWVFTKITELGFFT
jgi:hypothetical protein